MALNWKFWKKKPEPLGPSMHPLDGVEDWIAAWRDRHATARTALEMGAATAHLAHKHRAAREGVDAFVGELLDEIHRRKTEARDR